MTSHTTMAESYQRKLYTQNFGICVRKKKLIVQIDKSTYTECSFLSKGNTSNRYITVSNQNTFYFSDKQYRPKINLKIKLFQK